MTSPSLWLCRQPWADQVHIDPTKTKATVRDSRAVAFVYCTTASMFTTEP
jgi:hypothetical protein